MAVNKERMALNGEKLAVNGAINGDLKVYGFKWGKEV